MQALELQMFPEHHRQAIGEFFPGLGPYPHLPGPFPVCAGKPGIPGQAPPPRLVPQQKFPVPSAQTSGHRSARIKHGVNLAQVLRPALAQAFLQQVRALQCKVTMDLQHEVRNTGISSWAHTHPWAGKHISLKAAGAGVERWAAGTSCSHLSPRSTHGRRPTANL